MTAATGAAICTAPASRTALASRTAAVNQLPGEYISVASQKDAEEADIEKERAEQRKGPHARLREFEELVGLRV
jgi:VIT1/CCC1 family predicted Fe2+/Mn2+ transporter